MQRMVFCNIGWMRFYNGLKGDEIRGGGSFTAEQGYGWEIFNFRKINGKVYGHVQPTGNNNDLTRLGGKNNDEYIKNILVVFTAAHEYGGTYIVGWYKNATFYRHYQEERLKERYYKNNYLGYYIEADANNSLLLDEDERFAFEPVPRGGLGEMGHSNVWYADNKNAMEFKERVLEFINRVENKQENAMKKQRKYNNSIKQNTVLKRKIENIAIHTVTKYYEECGYNVKSREKDNLGWDLDVKKDKIYLKVEVKGLSGMDISVDLSRNEYENMNSFKKNGYRLCIVTDCLQDPCIHLYSYSKEKGNWVDKDENDLEINEIIMARCRA